MTSRIPIASFQRYVNAQVRQHGYRDWADYVRKEPERVQVTEMLYYGDWYGSLNTTQQRSADRILSRLSAARSAPSIADLDEIHRKRADWVDAQEAIKGARVAGAQCAKAVSQAIRQHQASRGRTSLRVRLPKPLPPLLELEKLLGDDELARLFLNQQTVRDLRNSLGTKEALDSRSVTDHDALAMRRARGLSNAGDIERAANALKARFAQIAIDLRR